MTRFAMLSSIILLASSTVADAQVLGRGFRADSGGVVRFHLANGRTQTGKLLAPFAADSVAWRFCHYPAPSCVPGGARYRQLLVSDVRTIDLHRGTQAGTGALVGGCLGLLFTAYALTETNNSEVSTGGALVIGLSVAALVTGVSALVGGMFDLWQPVSGNGRSLTSAWSLPGAPGGGFRGGSGIAGEQRNE